MEEKGLKLSGFHLPHQVLNPPVTRALLPIPSYKGPRIFPALEYGGTLLFSISSYDTPIPHTPYSPGGV